MNDQFESDEAPDRESLEIEEQLRAFLPRQPRLDWDRLKEVCSTGTASNILHSPIASANGPQASFRTREFLFAMAASLVLGLWIGGGATYWSMSGRSVVAENPQRPTPESSGSVATPERSVAVSGAKSDNRPAESPVDESVVDESPVSVASTPLEFEIDSLSWAADEPLSPRSVGPNRSRRLTALSQPSTKSESNVQLSNTAISESIESEPFSNHKQLLKQYLEESSLVY